MIYDFTLQGHVENLTSGQDHDLVGKGHVLYQSIRIVGHLWCFHRPSWSLSKVIAEKLLVTFHDLK